MSEEVSQLGEEFDIPSVTRRQLLPLWIKIFSWIFVFMGLLAVLALIFAMLEIPVSLVFFGLESNNGTSMTGMIIILMFILKAVVGIGLLGRQKWAVDLAIADGVLGILLCLTVTIIVVMQGRVTFRLEILLLALYLWKMLKIRSEWKRSPQ